MMNRRSFGTRVAAVGAGWLWFAGCGCVTRAARQVSPPNAPGTGPKDRIDAGIENGILQLDYRLAALPDAKSRPLLLQATFVTAIAMYTQRPLCCRSLAGVSAVSQSSPGTVPGYRVSVPLTALFEKVSVPVLIHASLWQHRSAVLYHVSAT